VVHERSVGSGDDGVERNSSNQTPVITGAGFHRADAAGWSRRFEQVFNRFLVGDFLQGRRGRLYIRDQERGSRHFVHGCPLEVFQSEMGLVAPARNRMNARRKFTP
jgi:hypothetical protein